MTSLVVPSGTKAYGPYGSGRERVVMGLMSLHVITEFGPDVLSKVEFASSHDVSGGVFF